MGFTKEPNQKIQKEHQKAALLEAKVRPSFRNFGLPQPFQTAETEIAANTKTKNTQLRPIKSNCNECVLAASIALNLDQLKSRAHKANPLK